MPMPTSQQTSDLIIGVDVGGTFTDLVALDPTTGQLNVIKIPSTPPDFHLAVLDAVAQAQKSPPSPGTPGEGRGEGDSKFQMALDKPSHPHPNPLPAYRERGQI
ncbi:MAG TPA: hydantoinase/oxoprolinase N-terminal domain-containing protein, partial [Tepidisphaeraceae bacterium]|nr:hydantoinase/oxoprolinase N-terminal domain-containing protein [Tepidisphaeraceae bacterium]